MTIFINFAYYYLMNQYCYSQLPTLPTLESNPICIRVSSVVKGINFKVDWIMPIVEQFPSNFDILQYIQVSNID